LFHILGVDQYTLYDLKDLSRKTDRILSRIAVDWSNELLGLPFRAK